MIPPVIAHNRRFNLSYRKSMRINNEKTFLRWIDKHIPPIISEKQSKEIQQNWIRLKNFDIWSCMIFGCCDQRFFFWKGDWTLDTVSIQFWDFPNIFQFPKLLSLKLLGNSRGNNYALYFIVHIKWRFTCG